MLVNIKPAECWFTLRVLPKQKGTKTSPWWARPAGVRKRVLHPFSLGSSAQRTGRRAGSSHPRVCTVAGDCSWAAEPRSLTAKAECSEPISRFRQKRTRALCVSVAEGSGCRAVWRFVGCMGQGNPGVTRGLDVNSGSAAFCPCD